MDVEICRIITDGDLKLSRGEWMKKWFESIKKLIKNTPAKVKIPIALLSMIIILSLAGYLFILFGGKLVVDEEAMIQDAVTTIESEDGEIIGKLYEENRIPIHIETLPDHVKKAFIAIEDRRFYEHAGVDMKSVARAVYRDILAGSKVEGASTITQQLAKNVFLHHDKTWMRKTKEVMAAIYLERHLSKEHILELYINQIYFGHGVYGIEAASQKFFSKTAKELEISEAALIAGLAKAPNGYSPINHPDKALKRRNIVLRAMEDMEMLSTEDRLKEQGKTLGLKVQSTKEKPWMASYIDIVTKEAAASYKLSINELRRGGYRIIVNVDDSLQQIAYKRMQEGDYFPGNSKGVEGAFVMTEAETGSIVAAIGGRNYQAGDLNRLFVKRQPGSTLKPIAVYGPAMMRGEYGPYSLLTDQKMEIEDYAVRNSDGKYEGIVSMYNAIKDSKNIAAVWLLNQIGIPYSKDYLEKMNISIPDEGLAIALGGLRDGVTPLQMVEAYGTFASNGTFVQAKAIDQIYDKNNTLVKRTDVKKKKVFSPQVAWNMTRMLEAVVQNGTGQSGSYHKALAGKTGSTGHPLAKGKTKDAWFVGYTPEYVTALWMGYDQSDEHHYLTGGSSFPTTLTKAMLTEMDKTHPQKAAFAQPADVEEVEDPIILPEIKHVKAEHVFGGFALLKAKLTWEGSEDERVIYRIYRKQEGIDKKVGEVEGKHMFTLTGLSAWKKNAYYVVPYDPLTKLEGAHSQTVELAL